MQRPHHGEVLVAPEHLHGDGAAVRRGPRRTPAAGAGRPAWVGAKRGQAPGDCGAAAPAGANATSLNPCRIGASRFQPIRVTEAVRRWRRQYRSGVPERPGHGGLDRRDVADHDHVAVGGAGRRPPPRRRARRRPRRCARPPRPASRPPRGGSGGRPSSAARPWPGCRPGAGTRTRRSRPRPSARRRSPADRGRAGRPCRGPGTAGSSAPRPPGRAPGRGRRTAWARPVSVRAASVRPSSRPRALASDSP